MFTQHCCSKVRGEKPRLGSSVKGFNRLSFMIGSQVRGREDRPALDVRQGIPRGGGRRRTAIETVRVLDRENERERERQRKRERERETCSFGSHKEERRWIGRSCHINSAAHASWRTVYYVAVPFALVQQTNCG